ncbi:MAG: glycosyltransferase family 2 protein [Verrucomicrobiae bacterium]|nr:glycosyltransferase family 2 protein [Verrucomicrobiae bacterium]
MTTPQPKLIIQIPCLNEEETLPITVSDLPQNISGISKIERLVIDDGSTDRTVEVARANHVEHILSLGRRCGLAKAFMSGITRALELGADIIVNTDADNQYVGADIAKLVEPILKGEADVVIGARPISKISHFSPLKKILQKLGSAVLRQISQTTVVDAPSGFRAYSREAALRMSVFSRFTYTMETLIQAGRQGLRVVSVPIRVNGKLRESRLFKGMGRYIARSMTTMIRIYVLYAPLRFFLWLGTPLFLAGMLFMVRWLIFFLEGSERTRIPSLILAAVLILMGVQLLALGVIADLIAKNRMLSEELVYRARKSALNL